MMDDLTMRAMPLADHNPCRLPLNMESVEGAELWAEVYYYHRK